MDYRTLLLTSQESVALLTLNRPDAMNSINQSMKDELALALDEVEADALTRVLVITGAGDRAFCAGADIKERAGTVPTPAEFYFKQQAAHRLFDRIERFPKPVLAAINGVALGGGAEIALCADIRLMSESATIGFTEVNLGVIPAAGGTQRLPRLIGASRAKELIFTGTRIQADAAAAIGLVNRSIPATDLRAEAMALARQIASKPPLAVRFAKQAIDQGQQTDSFTAMAFELYAAAILFDTDDRKEGMRAFVEKRPPAFSGR